LLASILPSNDLHLHRAIDAVSGLGLKRIGVYGISFKDGTDDFRQSPALTLVEELDHRGIEVHLFDPAFLAVHQNSPSITLPGKIRNCLSPSLDQWLASVDGIALTQPATPEAMKRMSASALPILDLSSTSVFSRGLIGANA
jgi:GDP-mannose 6-dehydrogenase